MRPWNAHEFLRGPGTSRRCAASGPGPALRPAHRSAGSRAGSRRCRVVSLLYALIAGAIVSPAAGKSTFQDPLKEIPAHIRRATTARATAPYLHSKDAVTRMAAVRRLGQIGGAEAVALIVATFRREPRISSVEASYGVKQDCIQALGRIGGERAKAETMRILNEYLRRGCRDERYVQNDPDFLYVVDGALAVLAGWSADPKVFARLRELSVGCRPATPVAGWVREVAYKGYLLGEMHAAGVGNVAAAVRYLLPRLTGRGAGHKDDWEKTGKTLEAGKNTAICDILVGYGPAALPHLVKPLGALRPEEHRKREALEWVISTIRFKAKMAKEDAGHGKPAGAGS